MMIEQASIEMSRALGQRLLAGGKAWLFLDYDGTLAEFAPTPDHILPDAALIRLIRRLSGCSALRMVILSGRKVSQIQDLLPVSGVLLAGTYGIEFTTWEGEDVRLMDMQTLRPFLEQVKRVWHGMIAAKPGYFLEDKGYALALHAKNAQPDEGQALIARAEQAVRQLDGVGVFHVQAGAMFLEVAPDIANKGTALRLLVERFPWPEAEVFYIGDDDKDEAAFEVVRQIRGIPIVVSGIPRPTLALYRLQNTEEVRRWLSTLADTLEQIPD